jgi:hypothetical protein
VDADYTATEYPKIAMALRLLVLSSIEDDTTNPSAVQKRDPQELQEQQPPIILSQLLFELRLVDTESLIWIVLVSRFGLQLQRRLDFDFLGMQSQRLSGNNGK